MTVSKQQPKMQQINLGGDNGSIASQRPQIDTTMADRVGELLEINGRLRATSGSLRIQLEQRDVTIRTLEERVASMQSEHKMDELMLRRQLLEWQKRSQAFENQVHEHRRALRIKPSCFKQTGGYCSNRLKHCGVKTNNCFRTLSGKLRPINTKRAYGNAIMTL